MVVGSILSLAYAWTPQTMQARLDAVAPLHELRHSTIHPTITRAVLETLGAGDVATGLKPVDGKSAKIAWGVKLIEVPIRALFSAVNDDLNKPQHSKLSHVRVLQGSYCDPRRLTFQFLPVPLVNDRWWVVEQKRNTALAAASGGSVRELTWVRQRQGEPLLDATARSIASGGVEAEENDGGWWLLALDAKTTLIQFWALSDPGGSVPAGLVSPFASRSIRETFGEMEALARKGPACQL